MIFVREPLQAQPRWPTLIDRQNQLGNKVITYIPLSSEVPRSSTQYQAVTLGTGGSYVATLKGRGVVGTGASGVANVPIFLSLYGQITVSFWFYWPVYGVADNLLMEFTVNYNVTAGGFIFDPDDPSGTFVIGTSVGSPNLTNSVSIVRPAAAVWHRMTACFDITNAQTVLAVYVDGFSQALSVVAANAPVVSTFANDTLHILSRNEGSLFGTGPMQDLTIYKGVLSAGEALADYVNPYQILRPRQLFTPESFNLLIGSLPSLGPGIYQPPMAGLF